ncbi:MAG: 50S ribosomal protein L25/general stress protein Ctc [Pseudomonadales bacterium]|nr:50S ribosomal protein L25/general stress protein Ctc [Pseudomonadales bacterium]
MSDYISLTAELREDVGKGASRRLRRLGNKVPAIIYGAEEAPVNLTLAVNELTKAMEQEAFYSQILEVVVDGKASQAVIRDLQRNPASGNVQHIDFIRISANREMQVSVPLHFMNEESCVGVRLNNGAITHNLTEVEISCLPANLPEFIEIDMEEVDAGSSIHLSDLVLPEGVVIIALTHGEDRDIPVVSVTTRRIETEEGDEASADNAAGDADAAEGDSEDTGEEEE